MGQAFRAPKAVYQRSYYITTHVIDRLRLRSPDEEVLSSGVIYRPDSDLMNRIDEAIKSSISCGNVHHVWDRGEPARIIWISDWFMDGKLVYILLKRDAKNDRMWAAVTVFTESQFENNKRNNRWQWSDIPHPENLPARSRQTPQIEVLAPVSVKAIRTLTPVAQERRTPLALDEMVLFYYKTKDGKERFERHPYKDASEWANSIIKNADYADGTLETYSRIRHELKTNANKTPIEF